MISVNQSSKKLHHLKSSLLYPAHDPIIKPDRRFTGKDQDCSNPNNKDHAVIQDRVGGWNAPDLHQIPDKEVKDIQRHGVPSDSGQKRRSVRHPVQENRHHAQGGCPDQDPSADVLVPAEAVKRSRASK